MQKRGKTAAGTQRWKCLPCKKSGVRTRSDTHARHLHKRFVAWLTDTRELSKVAVDVGCSRGHLTELFQKLWEYPTPSSPERVSYVHVLIVDGVYLSGRTNAVLIGRTVDAVALWHFAKRENQYAWLAFFSRIDHADVVVMDGQKGLVKAVLGRFPDIRIQRCLVHVERFVRSRISMRPKTDAGKELWKLTRTIWEVKTHDDAHRWCAVFALWEERHARFLKEKTYPTNSTQRPWYTHRTLRAARSHIKNALPHLFTFTEVCGVPRTTNHVEGGVNARLKELIRRHRGFSPERKRVLAAYFLASKRG